MNRERVHQSNIYKILLAMGIASTLLYPITDILAGVLYKGYSFNEQAISELFAIGAPTSRMVVSLFTICSVLFIGFGLGIGLSSNNRLQRILAVMVIGNAINSLVLWNFFPMHMRGAGATFTDTMHTVLAINPFILISIILGAVIFKGWFRFYSLGTILLLLIPAVMSFSYIPLLIAHQPTPWMGFTERLSQYGHQLWHAILAIVLIRGQSNGK